MERIEIQEFEDGTIPLHVAHFYQNKKQMQILDILDRAERKHLDDDEMREVEPGQTFVWYNLFR